MSSFKLLKVEIDILSTLIDPSCTYYNEFSVFILYCQFNNLVIRPESPYVPSVRPGPGELAPLLSRVYVDSTWVLRVNVRDLSTPPCTPPLVPL